VASFEPPIPAPAHSPSDVHANTREGDSSELSGGGCALHPPPVDEGGRKRRADDTIHEDSENSGIDYAAKLEDDRRQLSRQPPLGVVRQLCLEAAQSRFYIGVFGVFVLCVCFRM